MPLGKGFDPKKNPSYGVVCVRSVLVLCVVRRKTAGLGKKKRRDIPPFLFSAGFALVGLAIL
ncbi:hypothetical protein ACVGWF_20750, partial [Enterobacter asburiae]